MPYFRVCDINVKSASALKARLISDFNFFATRPSLSPSLVLMYFCECLLDEMLV